MSFDELSLLNDFVFIKRTHVFPFYLICFYSFGGEKKTVRQMFECVCYFMKLPGICPLYLNIGWSVAHLT